MMWTFIVTDGLLFVRGLMKRVQRISHGGKPLSCFRGIAIAIGNRERNKQNPLNLPEKIADLSFSMIEILITV